MVLFDVATVEFAGTKSAPDDSVSTQEKFEGPDPLLHNVVVKISLIRDMGTVDVLLLRAFSGLSRVLVLVVKAESGGGDMVLVGVVIASEGGVDVVEGESAAFVVVIESLFKAEFAVTAIQLEVLVTVTVRVVLNGFSREVSPGGLVCHVQSTIP